MIESREMELATRNAFGLADYRAKRREGMAFPDAWRPLEREFLTFVQARELERAGAWLDRNRFERAMERRVARERWFNVR